MTGHELEQNESVPDLVVGPGVSPPLPAPASLGTSPNGSQDARLAGAVIAALLIGPIVGAFLVRLVTSRGPWSPDLRFLLVALIALFAATRFVVRSQKLKVAHVSNVGLRELEAENWQVSIAIALVVIAEFGAIASFDLWAGLGLIGLVLAWTLLSLLPWLRRTEVRSSVQAACTPEAAFALVSNPQNWHLWAPELELVQTSEAPLRPGTVVRSRMRAEGRLIEVEERVTVFEPPRRCGSELLGVPGASDMYLTAATAGGTLITYIFRFLEPLNQAPLGGAFFRRNVVKTRRKETMQRIKQLLEKRPSGSV